MNFSQSQIPLNDRAEDRILTDRHRCGEVKRLVMGLDRFTKTPCGFCFVEYYTHQDALDCLKYVGGTKLDERIIRTDLDPGFEEGRQYGYVERRSLSIGKIVSNIHAVVVNLVGRFATNTEKSTTQDVAVMDGLMQMIRDNGKKKNTVRVGNIDGTLCDWRMYGVCMHYISLIW